MLKLISLNADSSKTLAAVGLGNSLAVIDRLINISDNLMPYYIPYVKLSNNSVWVSLHWCAKLNKHFDPNFPIQKFYLSCDPFILNTTRLRFIGLNYKDRRKADLIDRKELFLYLVSIGKEPPFNFPDA